MQRAYLGDSQVARLLGDASAATEAKNDWASAAKRWIAKRKREDQDGPATKRAQFTRKKSYMWGVTLHSILEASIGKGLQHFRAAPDARPLDAHQWPYLAVAPDQGVDGLSCGFFLRYSKHINLELWYDPSHGTGCGGIRRQRCGIAASCPSHI